MATDSIFVLFMYGTSSTDKILNDSFGNPAHLSVLTCWETEITEVLMEKEGDKE